MASSVAGGQKTPPVRDDLKDLKPYEVPVLRTAVELDSNENPWNLPTDVVININDAIAAVDFNRYPDIGATRLRQKLADGARVAPDNIMVGNGSNEVILDLLLAFGGPGRRAMLFVPTYSMHDVLTRIALTDTIKVPLSDDFSFDPDSHISAIREADPAIVFLTSPNNPTGNLIPAEVVAKVCRAGDWLVVVDEAYGEFSGETSLALVSGYKNLAVVKTFSKAFRLAAARVGYVVADQGIISGLVKVKLPYNLNTLSQVAAAAAWDRREAVLAAVETIKVERDRLFRALSEWPGLTAYPSRANFILFRTETDADEVFDRLITKQVQIRNFNGKPGLDNCLRVTIGAPAENDAFLAALKESL